MQIRDVRKKEVKGGKAVVICWTGAPKTGQMMKVDDLLNDIRVEETAYTMKVAKKKRNRNVDAVAKIVIMKMTLIVEVVIETLNLVMVAIQRVVVIMTSAIAVLDAHLELQKMIQRAKVEGQIIVQGAITTVLAVTEVVVMVADIMIRIMDVTTTGTVPIMRTMNLIDTIVAPARHHAEDAVRAEQDLPILMIMNYARSFAPNWQLVLPNAI